jgi:hypothetical protein
VALLAACSSSTTPATAPADASADGFIGCGGIMWDTYAANLVKAGQTQAGAPGPHTYTLVAADPAPPTLHTNKWTMKIVDAAGASPAASQVTAYPFMPQMNHGTITPVVTSNGDGTFTVSNLVLFMPGIWTVTFTTASPVQDDAGQDDAGSGDATADVAPPAVSVPIDDAVFTFCIGD